MKALGIIETRGLVAGIEAADVAAKSADVHLIGYELARGGGLVNIKIEGEVAAIQAAVAAGQAAASKVGAVVSVLVIPRPSDQVETLIRNPKTVGYQPTVAAPRSEAPAEQPAETPAEDLGQGSPTNEPAPEQSGDETRQLVAASSTHTTTTRRRK